MRQEDTVRNMVKCGSRASVTTFIAELPDGSDGVAPRAQGIQTKFCPEGRKWGSTRQRVMISSSPASEMRLLLKSPLDSEAPALDHGNFHISSHVRCCLT